MHKQNITFPFGKWNKTKYKAWIKLISLVVLLLWSIIALFQLCPCTLPSSGPRWTLSWAQICVQRLYSFTRTNEKVDGTTKRQMCDEAMLANDESKALNYGQWTSLPSGTFFFSSPIDAPILSRRRLWHMMLPCIFITSSWSAAVVVVLASLTCCCWPVSNGLPASRKEKLSPNGSAHWLVELPL